MWQRDLAVGLVAAFAAGCLLTTDLSGLAGPPPALSADAMPPPPSEASVDAATDARGDATNDAGQSCDVAQPFDAPTPLEGLTAATYDSWPRLSQDELTIVFARHSVSPPSEDEIYIAHRATLEAAFNPPTLLAATVTPNQSFSDDPAMTRDALTLFFTSGQTGTPQLWWTSRAAKGDSFGQAAQVTIDGSLGIGAFQPYFTDDDGEVWFSSNMDGGAGGSDLYRASRMNGALSGVTPLSVLNTSANEWGPTISTDGTTVFFARLGASDYDIWISTRASRSDVFSAPSAVAELNTPSLDLPGWLSPDGCRLYLTSERSGVGKLYVAHRHSDL